MNGRVRLIRVIYRWRVEPTKMHEFEVAWRQTTRSIHAGTKGALGSFCLQSIEDPSEMLTVALWETHNQWQHFIKTARSNSMRDLHDLGTQISATAYRQIGDETVMLS